MGVYVEILGNKIMFIPSRQLEYFRVFNGKSIIEGIIKSDKIIEDIALLALEGNVKLESPPYERRYHVLDTLEDGSWWLGRYPLKPLSCLDRCIRKIRGVHGKRSPQEFNDDRYISVIYHTMKTFKSHLEQLIDTGDRISLVSPDHPFFPDYDDDDDDDIIDTVWDSLKVS